MANDPEKFQQQFSVLTNTLQLALSLAEERAQRASGEHLEATELVEAVRAAADAARALRPTGREEA
jgi:hypothetical protein